MKGLVLINAETKGCVCVVGGGGEGGSAAESTVMDTDKLS